MESPLELGGDSLPWQSQFWDEFIRPRQNSSRMFRGSEPLDRIWSTANVIRTGAPNRSELLGRPVVLIFRTADRIVRKSGS